MRVEPPAGGVGTGLSATGEPVDPYALLEAAAADARSGPRPTVVLPILHGPNGEDGTVQGLLEVAGVPYVGAGVLGSAVSMDKAMAKTVLTAHGIAQVPWRELHHHEPFGEPGAAEALDSLGDTVFVKPANMGSSIGVAKVRRQEGPGALLEAVKDAFRYDDVVVLEAGITGRELEIAVLGNDDPRASEVGEITAGADFYDYSDKYFDGNAETTVPADLPAEVAAAARELAVRTDQGLERGDLVGARVEQHGAELEHLRGRVVREPRGLEVDDGERALHLQEALEPPEIHPQILGPTTCDLQRCERARRRLRLPSSVCPAG